jgi:CRP-like cAMP-binding protein
MGRLPAYCNIVVKVGGEIASIPLTAFNDARQKSVALRYLFARYADCLLAQIFQSAACNAVHSVDQRAAKWLIAVAERTGVREAPVTHEQLAAILGVGRSYVSGLLGAYKARGLVTMRRGCIELLDVDRLKARSCDCNAAVTAHFDEVLKGLYPDESRTT